MEEIVMTDGCYRYNDTWFSGFRQSDCRVTPNEYKEQSTIIAFPRHRALQPLLLALNTKAELGS